MIGDGMRPRAVWRRQPAALRAAGSGDDDGDGNEQATAACSDVRLFSSCGDSDVIRYSMFDLAFFVPGALETEREKKRD